MKYKVGDIVFSTIWNKSVLIKDIRPNRFYLIADLEYLSRTMITYEGNLKSREDDIEKDMEKHQKLCDEIMTIQGIEPIEAEMEQIVHCPEGYQFVDENGNVINATKIVLEKKKPKYPQSYEECCKVIEVPHIKNYVAGYKNGLLDNFQKLLICRDAYWKIAGEEMGLGKPWEPDWSDDKEKRYCIVNIEGNINLPEKVLTKWILKVTNKILVFPTEEMRDAFKENFDPDIEICKELL